MLVELLRNKIETCGKKRSEIARATGVDEAALSRIVYGGDCKTSTADRLMEYFGLTIVAKQRKGRGK